MLRLNKKGIELNWVKILWILIFFIALLFAINKIAGILNLNKV